MGSPNLIWLVSLEKGESWTETDTRTGRTSSWDERQDCTQMPFAGWGKIKWEVGWRAEGEEELSFRNSKF